MEVGKVVAGRYVLTEKLGEGGFAKVFRARHQDLDKDFALKVLNPDIAKTDDGRERFLREVESTSEVAHRYAVRLREAGRDPETGWLYFTMDLVSGRTLRSVLREGPLSEDRAVRLAGQVLEVLDEAHGRKLVHRDLKPENLMLVNAGTPDEEVRVLDFGIAKAVADADPGVASTLTQAGTVIGTPHYMSPEQAKGNKLDGRSDLYALGVILYEALSGRVPVDADPDAESKIQSLLWNIGAKPPVPLGEVAPGVTPAVRDAVMKALAKEPAARFATARDMREALLGTRTMPAATGVGEAATGVLTPAPPPPRRSRAPLVLVPLLLAVAGGLAVAFDLIELGPALAFAHVSPEAPMVVTKEPALTVHGRLTDPRATLLLARHGDAPVTVPVADDGSFTQSVPLVDGDQLVTFTARRGKHEVTRSIGVTRDAVAPKVAVQAPRSVSAGAPIEVAWTVEDETARFVGIAWRDAAGNDLVPPRVEEVAPPRASGTARFPTEGVTGGLVAVHVIARDRAGNATERSERVELARARALSITIASPPEDALLASGFVDVAGTLEGTASLIDLQLLLDGRQVMATQIAPGPWKGLVRVSVTEDGPHEIVARARDASGSAAQATATRHIRVDRAPPVLRTKVAGARITIESDEPLSSLRVGGRELISTPPERGPWRDVAVAAGQERILVVALDLAGNPASARVERTLASGDPWASYPVGTTFAYQVHTSRSNGAQTWKVVAKNPEGVTLQVDEAGRKARTVRFVTADLERLIASARGADDVVVPAGHYRCRAAASREATLWFADGIPLPVKKVEQVDGEQVHSELAGIER